ncbi:MAG: hypothetical protein IT364_15435 [Candidatus Hydrogenedentes bacterium]|nr:hypothetical protein [Candidatus Hydrogenedentota bacterium]
MASKEDKHPVTPVTLYRAALDFLTGAKVLVGHPDEARASHSFGLLVGFCLEDALKAFLCHTGDNETDLKGVGHDLVKAWKKAVDRGLALGAKPPQWCVALCDIYFKDDFYVRYPQDNSGMVVPNKAKLIDDLRKVLSVVGVALGMDEHGNFT